MALSYNCVQLYTSNELFLGISVRIEVAFFISVRYRVTMNRYLILIVLFVIVTSRTISSDFQRGYFTPAKDQPVLIEFERASKLIVIQAEVNGIKGKFLLDNGFSLSSVNLDFASRAGIEFDGSSNIKDANSKRAKIKEATVKTVNINGQIFSNTGFYLIDTNMFLPCNEIDGIIGASIIRKANWKIDFKKSEIQISSVPFELDGFKLHTRFRNNNSTFTTISIHGQKIESMIDLGSTSHVKLSKKKSAKFFKGKMAEKHFGSQSLSATGLGGVQTSYFTFEKVEISHNGEPLPASSKVLLREHVKYDGYFGVDYLDEYEIVMNSLSNEYILKFSGESRVTEREKTYGVSIYQIDGVWKVVRKDANNKMLDEINPMDTIQEIDGKPISKFKNICDFNEYIKTKKELNHNIQLMINNKAYDLPLKNTNLSKIN